MSKKLSALVGEAIQTLSAVREELKRLESASESSRQKEALAKVTLPPVVKKEASKQGKK